MYNSIMQKIARNLHKPHSSIITIVLLVKEIIITIKVRICRMWFFVFKIFLIIFKCTSIKILFYKENIYFFIYKLYNFVGHKINNFCGLCGLVYFFNFGFFQKMPIYI